MLFYQVLYRLADGFKPSYPFRRGVAFFCLRQRKSFVSNLHLFFFQTAEEDGNVQGFGPRYGHLYDLCAKRD